MSTVTLDDTITIALTVTDRAASAAWYEKHLGFETLFSADEAGWTELTTKTPGVTLGLGDSTKASPGNATPVFGVADIDAARRALEAESVRFDGDTITIPEMVKLATFFDPDENALMLAQDLTKRS